VFSKPGGVWKIKRCVMKFLKIRQAEVAFIVAAGIL
jgi:hypothetical protein